jgi:hypothetical protein
MSSGLRRPATRDSRTKYFIVLENMSGGSTPIYPPPIGNVTRIPTTTGTVTSSMTEAAFNAATANITPTYFQFPNSGAPRGTLEKGDILKDLGSTVYLFNQLGSPDSKHFATFRLVQLVAGGNIPPPDPGLPTNILTEGPFGSASNFYNTFWIRTWTSSPEWFHVAAIARTG